MTYQTQNWQSPHHRKLWQKFYNGSGETVPAFGVMRITDSSHESAEVAVSIAKPNTTFSRLYMVNGPVDIPAGSYGYGTLAQHATYALCNGSPAFGEEWGAKNGQWTLEKNYPGFFVMGQGVTGTAVVRQREVTHGVCKPYGANISKGSSGTVRVWLRNSGGTWADSTMELTATALGAAVTQSKYCSFAWVSGVWLVACWES